MASNAEWNQEVTCIADLQMTFTNFLTILVPHTHLQLDFEPSETGESLNHQKQVSL